MLQSHFSYVRGNGGYLVHISELEKESNGRDYQIARQGR